MLKKRSCKTLYKKTNKYFVLNLFIIIKMYDTYFLLFQQ